MAERRIKKIIFRTTDLGDVVDDSDNREGKKSLQSVDSDAPFPTKIVNHCREKSVLKSKNAPCFQSTPKRRRRNSNVTDIISKKMALSPSTDNCVYNSITLEHCSFEAMTANISPIANRNTILDDISKSSLQIHKLHGADKGEECDVNCVTDPCQMLNMLTQDDSVLKAVNVSIAEQQISNSEKLKLSEQFENVKAVIAVPIGCEKVVLDTGATDVKTKKIVHCELVEENFKDLPVNWTNDSMVHSVLHDNELSKTENRYIPFHEKIKQTLVMNAQKPITPKPSRTPSAMNVGVNDQSIAALKKHDCDDKSFFGLPSKVKSLIEVCKGIEKLYSWQEECLNLKAVAERRNLVYALPTSGGKTLVAEILIFREILSYERNALFVLPFVSIVQEKVRSMSPFAVELDFLVEEYAAGKGQYPPTRRRKKHSVYIATMEKALGIVNSLLETNRIDELGLVVVDELHLIGESDSPRSATLEILLTKLRFSAAHIHIIGMSATIGNIQEIACFLDAEIYTRNFRPVELKEYVKCEKNIFQLNPKAKMGEVNLSLVRTISTTVAKDNPDPDQIAFLVGEVVPDDSCLVFCATKKNCENVAVMICKIIPREILNHRKDEKEALLRTLISEGSGKVCPVLKTTIPFGLAYHHSGLTTDERRFLEEAFLTGTLCCLCCTSTLAAGVNLPARRVILRSPYVGRAFLTPSRYKQMVGRAGRAGFGEGGDSILICKPTETGRVSELVLSPMDDACSSLSKFDCNGLRRLVLSAVGLGLAKTRSRLYDLARCTLLYVQSGKLEIDVLKLTDKTLSHLVRSGALTAVNSSGTTSDGNALSVSVNSSCDYSSRTKRQRVVINSETELSVSKLGRAAMKGPIALENVHQLKSDLVQAQASLVLLSCLHLLYLVTPYDMVDQITPVPNIYFNVCNKLDKKDWQTARVLGFTEGTMVSIMKGQIIKSLPERVLKRFYLTLMVYDVWNHMPVWVVAEKYQVPRGFIQNLMVNSSTFASCVMRFCEELPEFWAFKDLLSTFTQRLSHCCTLELIPLMDLPAVKRGRAKQLYNAGFKTILDVANADPQDLVHSVDHMPKKVARQIVSAAKLLLIQKAETLREEAEFVLEGLRSNKENRDDV